MDYQFLFIMQKDKHNRIVYFEISNMSKLTDVGLRYANFDYPWHMSIIAFDMICFLLN